MLRIGILGPLELRVRDSPTTPGQRGILGLLAMLALSANRVVPVPVLIEALWGENNSPERERNLHTRVYQLRRQLAALEPGRPAPRLVTEPSGYRLALRGDELDLTEFADLAAQGRAALAGDPSVAARLLKAALNTWRGPALADVADLSPLLSADAAALEEQRLGVVEDHADAALAAGQAREMITELTGPVAAHPLRERLRGQLMLALYRSGRQAEALETYHQGARILADELGIDPSPDLRDLYVRMLRADRGLRDRPPAAAPDISGLAAVPRDVVPRQLPAVIRHFAGRAAELKELDAQIDRAVNESGTVVITAIAGTGGIGKTALALHWAHRAAARFPDGQLHVNLRGYDPAGEPVTSAEAIRNFLAALGVPPGQVPHDQDAQAGLYRSLIAGRRMLILADNAQDAAQVRPLIPASPGSLLLVTSRASMAGLAVADGAAIIPLGLLTEDEAVALLRARLGPEWIAANETAVTDVIKFCGRLPLALSIVAARAATRPNHPLADLVIALRDASDRLDALDTGDPVASVRSVFSWSYRQLPGPAAGMFRLLGLHPGPEISIPAAASLAASGRAEAKQLLARLTSASLLTEVTPGRYALHDLLRAYAAELVAADDTAHDRSAAANRMLDHYLHSAHDATLRIYEPRVEIKLETATAGIAPESAPDRQHAEAWFQAERPVLLGLMQAAEESGMDRHAWQLAWTMGIFLDRFGYWTDWLASQQSALAAAARLGDEDGQGHAHMSIGRATCKLGNPAGEQGHYEQALSRFTASGNLAGQASALHGTSDTVARLDRLAESVDRALTAAELFAQAGVPAGRADALNSAGCYQMLLGDFANAYVLCEQAFDIHVQSGTVSGQADAADSLGYLHRQRGDYDDAISWYRCAADRYAECGDPYGHGRSLIELGDTYEAAGQPAAAAAAWRQGLDSLGGQPLARADEVRAKLGIV